MSSLLFISRLLPIAQSYITRVKSSGHPELLIPHRLHTGICFFTGIQLVSLLKFNQPNQTDLIYNFTLFYILLDHYIDDPNVEAFAKKLLIQSLLRISFDPSCLLDLDLLPPIFQKVIPIYKQMLDKPKLQYILTKNLLFAVHTHKWQGQNSLLSRDNYFQISKLKGSLTIDAIVEMLGLTEDPNLKIIGECTQHVDDIMDVYEDIEAEINTIATFEYETRGNIDIIYLQTLAKINSLPKAYNQLCDILLLVLVYAIVKTPELVSKGVYAFVEKLVEAKGWEMKTINIEESFSILTSCLQGFVKNESPINN